MPISNRRDWTQDFLNRIADGWSVTDAVRWAKTTNATVYKRRKEDSDFRRRWQEAADLCTKLLEQEATRRAYHGTIKPLYYKGEQCGEVREYSDTLLMFMLRARRPEKYREKDKSGTVVQGDVNVQLNMQAASAIREMIADGTIQGILEGGAGGEPAPAEPAAPGGGGHAEVGESAAHTEDIEYPGDGVEDAEQ